MKLKWTDTDERWFEMRSEEIRRDYVPGHNPTFGWSFATRTQIFRINQMSFHYTIHPGGNVNKEGLTWQVDFVASYYSWQNTNDIGTANSLSEAKRIAKKNFKQIKKSL